MQLENVPLYHVQEIGQEQSAGAQTSRAPWVGHPVRPHERRLWLRWISSFVAPTFGAAC